MALPKIASKTPYPYPAIIDQNLIGYKISQNNVKNPNKAPVNGDNNQNP